MLMMAHRDMRILQEFGKSERDVFEKALALLTSQGMKLGMPPVEGKLRYEEERL